MVLQVDDAARPSLVQALRQFARHAAWLVPGILLVGAVAMVLSPVQGWVRAWIFEMWFGEGAPRGIKLLLFFGFVVTFATAGLWLTVAILVFVLRRSYREQASG